MTVLQQFTQPIRSVTLLSFTVLATLFSCDGATSDPNTTDSSDDLAVNASELTVRDCVKEATIKGRIDTVVLKDCLSRARPDAGTTTVPDAGGGGRGTSCCIAYACSNGVCQCQKEPKAGTPCDRETCYETCKVCQ